MDMLKPLIDIFHEISININKDIVDFLTQNLNEKGMERFKSLIFSKPLPRTFILKFAWDEKKDFCLKGHYLKIQKRSIEKSQRLLDHFLS